MRSVMRIGTATGTLVELGLVLLIEGAALFLGQRQLFRLAVDATGSRLLGYLLAMPGTVVHEGAHYLACILLRVPVGRQVRTWDGRRARVRWFFPTRDLVTGSVTLGMVPHAKTDPMRGALIAIAPLLVVPPLLVAIVFLVTGTTDLTQLRHVLPDLATWRLVLLAYLAFSCAQAAFPSRGDHVGVLGGLTLSAILGVALAVILARGGRHELTILARDLCLLLSVPAIASGLSLAILFAIASARRAI
ncbi:MAG: hypothetical protein ACLP22_07010 [Solirubrobacteraceae bacterium]